MPDPTTTTEEPTRPHHVLRDRVGGISDALKQQVKEHHAQRKRVREALSGGARTIPEVARAADIEPAAALWMVMTLRRDGEIAESGVQGDYVLYTLIKGV